MKPAHRRLTTAERRLTVLLGIPLVLPYVFVSTLVLESLRAWRSAYLDVRIEMEQMHQAWTNPDWRPH